MLKVFLFTVNDFNGSIFVAGNMPLMFIHETDFSTRMRTNTIRTFWPYVISIIFDTGTFSFVKLGLPTSYFLPLLHISFKSLYKFLPIYVEI